MDKKGFWGSRVNAVGNYDKASDGDTLTVVIKVTACATTDDAKAALRELWEQTDTNSTDGLLELVEFIQNWKNMPPGGMEIH